MGPSRIIHCLKHTRFKQSIIYALCRYRGWRFHSHMTCVANVVTGAKLMNIRTIKGKYWLTSSNISGILQWDSQLSWFSSVNTQVRLVKTRVKISKHRTTRISCIPSDDRGDTVESDLEDDSCVESFIPCVKHVFVTSFLRAWGLYLTKFPAISGCSRKCDGSRCYHFGPRLFNIDIALQSAY